MENRVPTGMLLAPIENPKPRDCIPLDTPVFVTCVYTNFSRLVYCTLPENTKIPQTSTHNGNEICGIFYRTHNTLRLWGGTLKCLFLWWDRRHCICKQAFQLVHRSGFCPLCHAIFPYQAIGGKLSSNNHLG